ncbi:MAG: GNAT family N-acetyltransferase [Candidatus Parcubacteria bacterium]|nr:GNAT family N-acetyltransferase [Candidatus Parcubacteria bacterium]
MQENINIKLVADLNDRQLNQLVSILNYDQKLRQSLCSQKKEITVKTFNAKNNAWAKNNQAKLYAIMNKTHAIGMISLSHINLKNKKANIGYWLTSRHWGKGITSKAFKQILAIAKDNKIKYLTCTIPKDNIASLAIWQKFQAIIKQKGENIIPIIRL